MMLFDSRSESAFVVLMWVEGRGRRLVVVELEGKRGRENNNEISSGVRLGATISQQTDRELSDF